MMFHYIFSSASQVVLIQVQIYIYVYLFIFHTHTHTFWLQGHFCWQWRKKYLGRSAKECLWLWYWSQYWFQIICMVICSKYFGVCQGGSAKLNERNNEWKIRIDAFIHSFHSTCSLQWLAKCPRWPAVQHQPQRYLVFLQKPTVQASILPKSSINHWT